MSAPNFLKSAPKFTVWTQYLQNRHFFIFLAKFYYFFFKFHMFVIAILVHNSAQHYIKLNSDAAKEFTFRMSACHMSYVTFSFLWLSGETSWWRVCYKQGTPSSFCTSGDFTAWTNSGQHCGLRILNLWLVLALENSKDVFVKKCQDMNMFKIGCKVWTNKKTRLHITLTNTHFKVLYRNK